jgi:hypothetical protein
MKLSCSFSIVIGLVVTNLLSYLVVSAVLA